MNMESTKIPAKIILLYFKKIYNNNLFIKKC